MKKLFLLTLIFATVVSLYASDGFVLGGDPCETYCFKEDFGKSLNRVFDATITLNTITNAQPLLTHKVAMVFDSNKVYAFDLKSGESIWQFPKDSELSTTINGKPTAYEGMVYFIDSDKLNCVDELTGKVIWKKNVPRSISPVLKVYNDVLYACCDDNNVYRIDPFTGDDIDTPVAYPKGGSKNSMLINKDYLIIVEESFLKSYNFNTKKTFTIQIPATAANFSPILLNDYIIVTSGEQIFLFNPKTGKKISQKKFPTGIVASSITDGKNIYVACLDSKIYKVKLEKRLSEELNSFDVPNSVKKLIAANDNNILAVDTNGLFFNYDLNTKSVVWQFQPGMYNQGGVTTSIPGIGTADITTETEFVISSSSSSQGGMDGGRGGRNGRMGGGPGGMGGGPGGPMGAFRSQGLDDFTNSIFSVNGNAALLAQGPMGGPGGQGGRGGRGGRNGRNGRNGEMGGADTRNTVTKTITYTNVLKANGNVYDIDFDKFFNDPCRQFIPSPIVSYPFYNNGYLGYVSLDGHFRVRSLNSKDNTEPYIFEYTPGSADTKVVSANRDILVKIIAFDKGSGIDFRSAKLVGKDANGKEYNTHLIYDPNKQLFCGYIRNNSASNKIVPFADGNFTCEFSVKDYAGNLKTIKIVFRIDASVEKEEEFLPRKRYYDVESGEIIEVDGYDYSRSDLVLNNSSNKSGSGKENSSKVNSSNGSGSGNGGVSGNADSSKKKSDVNNSTSDSKNSNDNNSTDEENNLTSNINNGGNGGKVVDGEYQLSGYNRDIVEVSENKVDTPKKKSSGGGGPIESNEDFYPPNPPKW